MSDINQEDLVERFNEIVEEMSETFESKNADYGNSAFETYKEHGMESFVIRLTDKLNRLKQLDKKESREVEDESLKDTLLDNAVYSIMGVVAMEEVERGDEDRTSPVGLEELRNDITSSIDELIGMWSEVKTSVSATVDEQVKLTVDVDIVGTDREDVQKQKDRVIAILEDARYRTGDQIEIIDRISTEIIKDLSEL